VDKILSKTRLPSEDTCFDGVPQVGGKFGVRPATNRRAETDLRF